MNFLRQLRDITLQSLPLAILITLLLVFIKPMNIDNIVTLIVSFVMVLVGQTFFLLGLEKSILPMGEYVGTNLAKLKKMIFIVLFGLIFGLFSSMAEPALMVIAKQYSFIDSSINLWLIIFIVSFGVGVSVAFALYKIAKNIPLKWIFLISYGLIIILCIFVKPEFIGISFDISGATTGDLSTPFIITLGVGVARTISSKKHDNEFGLIGIASIGPLLAFLIFGVIKSMVAPTIIEDLNLITTTDSTFLSILLTDMLDCFLALLPVLIIFFIFNAFFVKLPRKKTLGLIIASIVVYFGLLIFLVGVDYGFTMAGKHFGEAFVNNGNNNTIFFGLVNLGDTNWFKWLLLPVSFLLCFFITLCEPSIKVLANQVEEITQGSINKKVLTYALAIGIGLAGLLCILNILLDISILYFIVPLYIISLVLTIPSSNLFIGVAFDSGGVTGGAITSAFLVPMCLSVAQQVTSHMNNPAYELLKSGFGIIGYMSITPVILVLSLGLIYDKMMKKKKKLASHELSSLLEGDKK